MSENQIIVYQPNETVHLDVRVENETVWLTQHQMAILFGCSTDNIGLHLKNVYAVGELSRDATTEDFSVVRIPVIASLLEPPLCGYQTIRFAALASAAGRRSPAALYFSLSSESR